jgi:hypothetical protein
MEQRLMSAFLSKHEKERLVNQIISEREEQRLQTKHEQQVTKASWAFKTQKATGAAAAAVVTEVVAAAVQTMNQKRYKQQWRWQQQWRQ